MSAGTSQPTTKRVNKSDSIPSGSPKFLTIREFAQHFSMSVAGVHKAIGAGTLKSVELPGAGEKIQRRIPYSEVQRIELKKSK